MKTFAAKTARPLPVIILADISGSMEVDGKIGAMNSALKDLISSFSKESRLKAEIHLSIITFGNQKAEEYLPLTPAHKISDFNEFSANGNTPMGAAFQIARTLIEDNERIPSRAFRPVIVLVSDGYPNDDWENEFKLLCDSERAQKATRMAMAIGNDADENMLKDFINDPETPLFKANNAKDIIRFFRIVSMSVTSRSRSTTPDEQAKIQFEDIPDDFDLEF